MTRKDYQMIAEAIRDARDETKASGGDASLTGVDTVADYIADGLLSDNPAFDRKRFMAACGLEEA